VQGGEFKPLRWNRTCGRATQSNSNRIHCMTPNPQKTLADRAV
jgi:hypothetical protein